MRNNPLTWWQRGGTRTEKHQGAPASAPGGTWLGFFQSRGRLGRVRFLFYTLTLFLFMAITGTVSNSLWSRYYLALGDMLSLLMIVILVMVIVMGAIHSSRRLNDFGASSWWLLLFFIPPAFPILLLILIVVPGSSGENRFGPVPAENSMKMYVVLFLVVASLILLSLV